MKISINMRTVALTLAAGALGFLAGCGGGGRPIAVAVTSGAPHGLDQGQSTTITATVSNDSTNSGVTWALNGPGTLSGSAATSVTYTAPASVTSAATATITAASVKNPSQTASTTIAINPPPSITTTKLPNGTVGAGYSQNLNESGGASPFTWALASGSNLPAGLTLSNAGAITGTPTAVGSTTFTVTVTDSASPAMTAQQKLTIVVVPAPVVIATTSLSGGIVGTAYSATLTATGGTAPFTWSIVSGSLPAGLSLSGAGVISGTPSASGTFNFTVQAADSSSPQLTATQALSLVIAPKLVITTTTLPAGTVGTAYSATLASTGGTGAITWTRTSGNLPAGLTLSSAGVISGTPTTAGSQTFTVQAMDSGTGNLQQSATQSLTLTINPAKLAITTASQLPAGAVGASYSQNLQASGGTTPYTWTLTSGTLPAGLSLSSAGAITGTPTATGTSTFTVQVADSGSPQQTATQQFSLTINAAAPLTITTTSLPAGTVNASYNAGINVTGGVTPYSSSVSSGSLPPGLTVSTCTSGCAFQVSGTPTTAGTYNFTLTVKDSETTPQTASQAYSIVISAAAPLSITTSSVPGGTVNIAYSTTLQASGGIQPYTWTLTSGTLPAGLSLSSAGVISGTPTASGTSTFTVQVADSESPAKTATQSYSITILAAGPNDGELKGTYAFLFSGYLNGGFSPTSGSVYETAAIGSFTADGNGNITSGELNVNNPGGVAGPVAVTGNYSVGSDNRGTVVLTFNNPSGNGTSSSTFAIAVGNFQNSIAQTVRFIQFDDTSATNPSGTIGDGVAKMQTTAAFQASTLKGKLVFGMQGESPCNTCGNGGSSVSPYGPVSAVGYFAADGTSTITTGEEDAAAMGVSYNAIPLAGSFTAPSGTTGRGTLVLTPSGTAYPLPPTHYVYYVVSSSELFMLSDDPHATSTMLGGDVRVQVAVATSMGAGNHVISEESSGNGDGVSVYPTQTCTTTGVATVQAGSQISLFIDNNCGGTVTSGSQGTVTYSIDANGRMTLSGSGSLPIFYLYDVDDGFGTEQPKSAGNNPGLIGLNLQTGGPFSNTTLSGNFFTGDVPPAVPMSTTSGVVNLNNGNASATTDEAYPGALTSGKTGTATYTTNSTQGRVVITNSNGNQNVLYIISPTKAVVMEDKSGNSTPSVSIVEQ